MKKILLLLLLASYVSINGCICCKQWLSYQGKKDVGQKLSPRSKAIASKVYNGLQSSSCSCPSTASAACFS